MLTMTTSLVACICNCSCSQHALLWSMWRLLLPFIHLLQRVTRTCLGAGKGDNFTGRFGLA